MNRKIDARVLLAILFYFALFLPPGQDNIVNAWAHHGHEAALLWGTEMGLLIFLGNLFLTWLLRSFGKVPLPGKEEVGKMGWFNPLVVMPLLEEGVFRWYLTELINPLVGAIGFMLLHWEPRLSRKENLGRQLQLAWAALFLFYAYIYGGLLAAIVAHITTNAITLGYCHLVLFVQNRRRSLG